jgi:uncharacterized membrane protein YjjP (DUF1212 family)
MPFSPAQVTNDARHDAETFVLALARALHAHGTPAHHLERDVMALAEALGVPAAVLCTPTSVQVGFGSMGNRVHLLRAEAESIDLGSLSRLLAIVDAVEAGALPVVEGSRRLARLHERPTYSRAVVDSMFALTSASAAVLFGGGLAELGAAAVAGLIVGELGRVMARSSGTAALFELVAALCVAASASIAASAVGSEPGVVVLSGLVVLVPGLRVTVALTELTAGHVVSGASRLAGAATVFLMLGIGVALGRGAIEALLPAPALAVPGASPLWDALALAVAPLTLVVLFEARARDTGWIWVTGVLAFTVARLTTEVMGPVAGSFGGALVAGLIGNAISRRHIAPAAVVQVPGMMLLVPGVLGLRSINAFVASDALGGIGGLFSVGVMASALAAGLAAADLLLRPRRPRAAAATVLATDSSAR